MGASVFYSQPPVTSMVGEKGDNNDEISKLDAEIREGEAVTAEAAAADQQLSSLVWICTSTHSISKVTFFLSLFYSFNIQSFVNKLSLKGDSH